MHLVLGIFFVSVYENTPEKLLHLPLRDAVSCLLSCYLLLVAVYLVVQGRVQLERNSHILLKELIKGTKPIWKAYLELNRIALSNSIAGKCTPM